MGIKLGVAAFAMPLNAVLACLTVKYITLPYGAAFGEGFALFWPQALNRFYDPLADRTMTLMNCSALAGYVFFSVFLCTFLDMFPSVMSRFKEQGHKNFFTAREWLQASGVATGNLLFCSHFMTIPVYHFIHRGGFFRGGSPMLTEDSKFDLPTAVMHFLMHAITIEIWFFFTHRALHFPVFYRAIHKFHHRFKAPTAVAAVYANPIEFCIGNVGGVVLGPALSNCHPYTAYFWMAFSLISTSMSHSGYSAFAAEEHDQHHEHFDYNYGVLGIMDTIFGTKFAGSPREKAVLAKRAEKQKKVD